MSKFWTKCPQCVPCSVDGCEETSDYCGSEPPADSPALCPRHDYDLNTDPLRNPQPDEAAKTLDEVLDQMWAHLIRKKAETGFDPATNSYTDHDNTDHGIWDDDGGAT